MIETSINRLKFLCETIPKLLTEIDAKEFSNRTKHDKWSKKEIIGHLIDSATNNHHRFVRAQFEINPTITYNQNNWNTYNHYDKIENAQLISFWSIYNKQITELILNIPREKLKNTIDVGSEVNLTIEFLFIDYVNHLEHHLRQVIDY